MSHTVAGLLREGTTRLVRVGLETPGRDAKLLLAHVLGVEPVQLALVDDPVGADIAGAYWSILDQRMKRRPVSHLLGWREFWGRRFQLDDTVLDPRPETECLIETALDVPFSNVLDLGTGSGCILLSLLAERHGATGIGVDRSGAALRVARENMVAMELVNSAAFLECDWYDLVEGTFDLIVSNPPYIAADEMAGLSPELSFEPRMALTDESDGLSCYRIIAAGADAHLNAGGWLMVEIGPTQGAAVVAMFEAAGLENVEIRHDLDGRDRVIVGQKPL